jgi:hypothetical protein
LPAFLIFAVHATQPFHSFMLYMLIVLMFVSSGNYENPHYEIFSSLRSLPPSQVQTFLCAVIKHSNLCFCLDKITSLF